MKNKIWCGLGIEIVPVKKKVVDCEINDYAILNKMVDKK